jgi:hypothetical protein
MNKLTNKKIFNITWLIIPMLVISAYSGRFITLAGISARPSNFLARNKHF